MNVDGFTRTVDWCYRYFRMSRRGMSRGGYLGDGTARQPHGPSYAASKAYQINYLESLRQKVGAAGQRLPIRVVDIRPGSVRTAMMKGEGPFLIASPQRPRSAFAGPFAKDVPCSTSPRAGGGSAWC